MSEPLDELDAFYLEHRRRGKLNTGVDDEDVWATCDGCGALFAASNTSGLLNCHLTHR